MGERREVGRKREERGVHSLSGQHRLLCSVVSHSFRPHGASVREISQARMLEPVATPYCKASSQPRDRTPVSCISCIGRWILSHGTTWEAPGTVTKTFFFGGGGEFALHYVTLVGKFALADHDAVGVYRAIKDSDSGKGLPARLSLMPRTLTCFETRFLTKLLLAVFF